MGLFRRKKKKEDESSFEWMTVGEALARDKMKHRRVSFDEVMERCTECCEQYLDAIERKLEVENEYEAVVSYLNDIQKIDELPPEQYLNLQDIARTMVQLNEERVLYQNKGTEDISPVQFLQMERFEEEIPSALNRLSEQEIYRDVVNDDIRNLEGERGVLAYEKKQAERKIRFLRKLSVASVAIVCLLFMVLLYISESLKVDLTIAFLTTGVMAGILAAYIIVALRKSRYELRLNEAKTNKAIALTNKIKLKYVNTTNAIEYIYGKYGVKSRYELEYLWERYEKVKADRERYRKNTEALEKYNSALAEALRSYGIRDAEVWIYQPEAILDPREMVEVRHHLNERRRTVKSRKEYAEQHFELVRTELKGLLECFPQFEDDLRAVVRKYHISM